jgi:hypothetical protein
MSAFGDGSRDPMKQTHRRAMMMPHPRQINETTAPGLNQADLEEFIRRVMETKTNLAKADGDNYVGERLFGNGDMPNTSTNRRAGRNDDGSIVGGPISFDTVAEPMSVSWPMWAGNHVQNASGQGVPGPNYDPQVGYDADPMRMQGLMKAMQDYAYQDAFKKRFPNIMGVGQ